MKAITQTIEISHILKTCAKFQFNIVISVLQLKMLFDHQYSYDMYSKQAYLYKTVISQYLLAFSFVKK